MMWRRCCFVVVLLLPFLATQVMAGASNLSKAKDVCSNLHKVWFMREKVPVEYEVKEMESVVSRENCGALQVIDDKDGKFKNAALVNKAKTLSKIHEWVCGNLIAANGSGQKSYIDTEFYDTLTSSLREAYESIVREAQLPELVKRDALDIFAASARESKLPILLANLVIRIPCFCRLLKLMDIRDKAVRKANSAMCHSLLGKPGTEFNLETYGAADAGGTFWSSLRVPIIRLKKEGTCTSKSLTALWEPEKPDNWFDCAATYMVNNYQVLLVPKGLMLYHGSRTLPSGTVPDGLTWYGDELTADEYTEAEWEEVHTDKPLQPDVHAFQTTKDMFVVRLMVKSNSGAMARDLPVGLDLRSVTGYPFPLKRESFVQEDREVFGALCPKWRELGIAGYAETIVDEVNAELMLCNSHGLVRSV